jgi:hypothetical protein
MTDVLPTRRLWIAGLPVLALAACAAEPAPAPVVAAPSPPPPPPADQALGPVVARVEITKWQAGFIAQASWGEGTLTYRGRRYRFRVRGLGAGGAGMARVRASGNIYNMTDIAQFPGVYGQARAGVVAPGAQLRGVLWLQNTSGVRMQLQPNRTGFAVQVGADGVLIEMA